MTYTEKLDAWYQDAKARGEVVDVKLFPSSEPGTVENVDRLSRAVFETLTGVRETNPLYITEL